MYKTTKGFTTVDIKVLTYSSVRHYGILTSGMTFQLLNSFVKKAVANVNDTLARWKLNNGIGIANIVAKDATVCKKKYFEFNSSFSRRLKIRVRFHFFFALDTISNQSSVSQLKRDIHNILHSTFHQQT